MREAAKVISQKIVYEGFSRISDCRFQPRSQNPDLDYIAPISREVLHCTNSVVVLIYAPDVDSFLLCREFRSGVFFNASGDDPFMWQCVAGMIDKDKTQEEIACMEAWEEAGVRPVRLTPICATYASPGRMTEKAHLFLAEVEGKPETGLFGLAEEGEEISTHLIPRTEVFRMMDEGEIIDAMTLLALSWFRLRKGAGP